MIRHPYPEMIPTPEPIITPMAAVAIVSQADNLTIWFGVAPRNRDHGKGSPAFGVSWPGKVLGRQEGYECSGPHHHPCIVYDQVNKHFLSGRRHFFRNCADPVGSPG